VAYSLRAFVAHPDILQTVKQQIEPAVVIPLEQNIGLIPITPVLYEAVGDNEPAPAWDVPVFQGLSKPLLECALQASASGMIAYVESEYFGGAGYQAVVVWRDEAEMMGPFLAYKFPVHEMPINRALRMLGVQIKDAADEFDTLGLGACRRTEDWVNYLGK
jgi:hypothetical protein